MKKVKVLMVCLGNICRSPTAEGVFRAQVEERNLQDLIDVDSAGTSDWHINEAPDKRSAQAAANRSYNLHHLRGRQVEPDDFTRFDYVLAMDKQNYSNLLNLCPSDYTHKIELFLSYAKASLEEVPDPYYSGDEGFEQVLDLIEDASQGLLASIIKDHELT